jgi:hypothetical protein
MLFEFIVKIMFLFLQFTALKLVAAALNCSAVRYSIFHSQVCLYHIKILILT